ncbi:MAG: type II toxin-antitoxin system HicB family antitoxin [Longimicrobiales bacterium]
MIDYKGYTGVFEFDPTIDGFHGRVVGLQDVVTFEGRSVEELRHEMEESIEDYLELCHEAGKEPERPYRGEFLVRTTPEVHRAVATAAEAAGMSLNAWVETTITTVVAERRPVSRKAKSTASATRARERS